MKNKDPKITRYQKLLAKLKEILLPELCIVESSYGNSITITINNYAVVFIPHKSDIRPVVSNKLVKIIYDEDYRILEKVVFGKKVNEDFEDASHYIIRLIKAFSKNTKKQAYEAMEKIYDYPLKEALIKYYQLEVNPLKEYFLFGDDEVGSRYRGLQEKLKIPQEGIKVQIKDSSALLFTRKDGKQFIDLSTGTMYMDKKFLYLDRTLVVRKQCSKKDSELVSIGPNNSRTYWKNTLKKGVDLKKLDKIPYKSADKMEFILKEKDGTMFFEDKNKQIISIHHPDLMIYILE
jgi:hypothetical protein